VNFVSIMSVTPTICELMHLPLPKSSTHEVLREVITNAEALLNRSVEKCFVYAPDAIGEALFRDYSLAFQPVTRFAPVHALYNSVSPPKTPICFASMFTGQPPDGHGITTPEKRVLTCETLFDILAKAGKKVSIVSVSGCSISIIFQKRALSYFTEKYDDEVNNRVLQLLEEDDCDFILAYNQEYDDSMHETGPRSEKALKAMRNHIRSFAEMSQAFLRRYRSHKCLLAFTPDHGAHLDEQTGKGIHGWDIPEDMEVRSFWGIYRVSS